MNRSIAATDFFRRTFLLTAVILSALAVFAFHASAQDLAKRLILKDGSYQLVTQYEVKGDRVRYKSAERDDWEELPAALVDWPATEKYEKERATSAIPEAAAVDKEKTQETDAERETMASHLPEVAPGLRLPEETGVFLLDNFHGQPQLLEMQQSEGDVSRNAKATIFRSPLAGNKQNIELEGEHAALHAHVAVPSIYINTEDADQPRMPPPGETASAQPSQPSLDAPRQQPQQPERPQQPEKAFVPFDRFRIVRVKAKNGKRIVGDVKRAINGKISQDENYVKTTIDNVRGGWLKLTPTENLAPGEYALIEMQGSEGMNLYVWDFAVDPNAPANARPYTPDLKDAGK
jgi:hypothetical protein